MCANQIEPMNIVEITQYSDEVLKSLNNLLPQLLPSVSPLLETDLVEIIQSEFSHLLMAKKDGQYYGSLTLTVVKIPTGSKVWIEDAVVNENMRGKGVGKLLIEHAVGLAEELGVQAINLTSSPSRKSANALYKRIGFELRETNVYRYKNHITKVLSRQILHSEDSS
jgi:GNAT superfamily N-acetyltransferase